MEISGTLGTTFEIQGCINIFRDNPVESGMVGNYALCINELVFPSIKASVQQFFV